MFKLKSIVNKVIILLIEILLFTFQVIKQIVLPTKKRKGNILSSLFILLFLINDTLSTKSNNINKGVRK